MQHTCNNQDRETAPMITHRGRFVVGRARSGLPGRGLCGKWSRPALPQTFPRASETGLAVVTLMAPVLVAGTYPNVPPLVVREVLRQCQSGWCRSW